MYRVMLVDDEPLILSGIKFSVDWEKNGCTLAGTARNGKQALEMIDELHPDIIIADINMPVMNGMQLLQAVSESRPEIVFIMLTNLQEFDLVQEALRLHAADYVLKSQLDTLMLEECLRVAITERKRRSTLSKIGLADEYIAQNRQNILRSAARQFLGEGLLSDEVARSLQEEGFWTSYRAILLLFAQQNEAEDDTDDENDTGEDSEAGSSLAQRMKWQEEVADKLMANIFSEGVIISTEQEGKLLLLCWGEAAANARLVDVFADKLAAASGNITGLSCAVLDTDVFHTRQQRGECLAQLATLEDIYYLQQPARASYKPLPELAPPSLSGLDTRLRNSIHTRNPALCREVMAGAIEAIEVHPHTKKHGLAFCVQIYRIISKSISTAGIELPAAGILANSASAYQHIGNILNRQQAVLWLSNLANELCTTLAPDEGDFQLIDQAKEFVRENISSRILLQHAAAHVCLSPGYFSTIFKKRTNQTFIDYVNQTKMEEACRLISEEGCRINEAGYMLGFENAYYFSKVFRKHIGMSPSQYKNKSKGDA